METPFNIIISFHKIIDSLNESAGSNVDFQANYAKSLLKEIEKYPDLTNGFDSIEKLKKHEPIIKVLLADLFPKALSNNEIKAITVPFHDRMFNHTQRFKNILKDAGEDFKFNIRDLYDDSQYIMNCSIILFKYFNSKVDLSYPLFYDIPDRNGIINHYRILFNADFIDIIPTEKAKILTEDEINLLINNSDDIKLWKEKFPPNSWILKGFGIVSLYNSTIENSVSNFKSSLLSLHENNNESGKFQAILKSIFGIPDLNIGFTPINKSMSRLSMTQPKKNVHSHIFSNANQDTCQVYLESKMIKDVAIHHKTIVVSDIESYTSKNPDEQSLIECLKSQNISSFIFSPIIDQNEVLGIVEVVSPNAYDLNSINAQKLEFIIPLLRDAVLRYNSEFKNQIDAIIQKEYTSIHQSVQWKFKEEALQYVLSKKNNIEYHLKEILFENVYPLYGQIDVQGSSNARNHAMRVDLLNQLDNLVLIFEKICHVNDLPLFEQKIFELEAFKSEIKLLVRADSEQNIHYYIENEIHPILEDFKNHPIHKEIASSIKNYQSKLHRGLNSFYEERNKFDETITIINKNLSSILDERQNEAQSYFPHYYERYKTDGVEHNMYIGASITPDKNFERYYINNLRLWQLQVMCEMEQYFQKLKPTLPYDVEVSSLLLVFSTPIAIRFRMDEKQFDIDGSYNVRYEIVKKRIDKAKIKGTEERITQKGKLTIVYSQAQEESEYLKYIRLLQHKNMLDKNIERIDVEDLQGITGLRALRVTFISHQKVESEKNKDKEYIQIKS
ncbi:GAF domain-containing protein [Gelidibacter japonicus]|uniref:GAF domain-containing protein n=1 Tax=Gelidibacter japonicus TaxID=1962232 RepID=UPI001F074CA0|nr:GAF domain-containing protein [Gelidibacter japonicus]